MEKHVMLCRTCSTVRAALSLRNQLTCGFSCRLPSGTRGRAGATRANLEIAQKMFQSKESADARGRAGPLPRYAKKVALRAMLRGMATKRRSAGTPDNGCLGASPH